MLQGYRLAGTVPLDFELRRYDRWAPDGAAHNAVVHDIAASVPAPSNVLGFSLMRASALEPAEHEHMKRIGGLTISLAAHGAYLSGTDLLLRLLSQDFGEWRHEPQRAASGAAMQALRTLAATSGAVGFHAMRQLAQALEMALRGLRACVAPQLVLNPAQRAVLERVLERSRRMLHDFALGDMPAPPDELIDALQQLRAQLQTLQPRRPAFDTLSVDAYQVDAGWSEQPVAQQAAQAIVVEPPALYAIPRVALVRVRADILERIAAHAGAVSHARARLEDDVVTLRAALLDFSENLIRLRRQLRDVEMQAEAQIASRMAIVKAVEFDPIEFDRCARLQELTRIMAGSVNDVVGVHQSLMQGVEIASRDLQQQADFTRAMQSDLRLVRTLPIDGGAFAQARAGVRLRRPQAGAALPGALTTA